MDNPDFRDMLCALNEADADFILAGAHALAAHRYVRATGELDIWVRANEANASPLLSILVEGMRMKAWPRWVTPT